MKSEGHKLAKSGLPRELDKIDRELLTALQNEGRLTYVDLSERVGITPPPCMRRIRELEKRGYIRGYHAELNPKLLGFAVIAFVQVALTSQAQKDRSLFAKRLEDWSIVREVHVLHGEADFLLRCVARSTTELNNFIVKVLLAWPNVRSTRTAISYGKIKSDCGLLI